MAIQPTASARKTHRMRTGIQLLAQYGFRTPAIAQALNISQKVTRYWKDRDTTEDAPRSGRPVVALTPRTKALITDMCKDKWNASPRLIAKKLNFSNEFIARGMSIGATTVRRFVKSTDWGKVAYKARSAPMLSEKNIRDRLAFSSKIMLEGYCADSADGIRKLDHLMFTDESYIELYPKPNAQNTRIRTATRGLREPFGVPKHGLKILVAGGLCAGGLSELYVSPANYTVTGQNYRQDILPVYIRACSRTSDSVAIDEKTLFEEPAAAVLMQDGAPAHTARATLALASQAFETLWSKGIWPGNSPDLNPIEHVWGRLQESVFIEPRPRNREELIARVHWSWKSINLELTKSLVYSFKGRIEQCFERQGRSTNY
jgi:transposase